MKADIIKLALALFGLFFALYGDVTTAAVYTSAAFVVWALKVKS